MEADQLEICSDSQLVVKQIEDSYKARGEKIVLYLKKVRELLKKFIRVQVRHVPRAENTRADALTKLATVPQEDLDRLIPVEHLLEPSVNIDDEEVSPVMPEGPFINEDFLHPSLSVWERKTPITCSKRYMKVSAETISKPGPWQQRH